MLLYPEIQRYAQQHIESVVGPSRLPTMDDEADLTYVRCLMKETLRRFFRMLAQSKAKNHHVR